MEIVLEIKCTSFEEKRGYRSSESQAPNYNNVPKRFLLLKQQGILFWPNNTEISADCNDSHSSKTVRSNCQCLKSLKSTKPFTKHPPTVKQG
ncbi:hypothetical protein pdam_00002657 [Pocillopora damicornis]|uniref:Uncharacterized protein n=1 Tax=Pocillopora damicornis TaxID=46731 RepID=A0A3M6U323_POCDA|nr:hypothetical protein pdam_00002657 [Pocillopora damicornis]